MTKEWTNQKQTQTHPQKWKKLLGTHPHQITTHDVPPQSKIPL